ncbi:MAG: putative transport system permease protein [Thermoanaerobaculia bacterium]|jgi:putative ABC transport system permease protein|nr:putative transport system permease protein [Thermoanaerobaculia bacterium]
MPFGPIIRAMRHNRMRFAFIIIEIAITLAIVTNAVNMILDERKKMLQQSGFDDDNLVSIAYQPFAPEFKEESYVEALVQKDMRAIHSIPGVKAVATTYFLPWQGGGSSGVWKSDGFNGKFQAQLYAARGEIFQTLGVKVTQGRAFVETDTPKETNVPTRVTIISRALAKKLWGNANPIGRVITNGEGGTPRTVIGIIDDFYNPYAWNIGEFVLFTPGRAYDSSGAVFLVRTEPGAMKSVMAQLEPRLLAVNPGRVFRSQTIAELKDQYFSGGKLVIRTMTGIIIILVFITALGIMGISSLAVTERTKQIGTRRALGATRGDILRHFLLENWLVTTAGLILGLIGAYGLNVLLVSKLSDVKLSWELVAGGMVLLWMNGLLSTVPAAMRATLVPPSIATRSV